MLKVMRMEINQFSDLLELLVWDGLKYRWNTKFNTYAMYCLLYIYAYNVPTLKARNLMNMCVHFA